MNLKHQFQKNLKRYLNELKYSNKYNNISYIINGDEMFTIMVLLGFTMIGFFKYLQIKEDE